MRVEDSVTGPDTATLIIDESVFSAIDSFIIEPYFAIIIVLLFFSVIYYYLVRY